MQFFFTAAYWTALGSLLRLQRFFPVLLLFFPAAWGHIAAVRWGQCAPDVNWGTLTLLFLGSLIMRSAGCVYNDLVDKDLDAQVDRTKKRPLAARQLGPRQAGLWIVCLLAGAGLVWLCLNPLARAFSLACCPLVAVYPWMKRITFWPQLFLGLAFSGGVFVGWATLGYGVTWSTLGLYTIGVLWTMAYDTIYAYQDYTDDLRASIKSSAVRLGQAFWPPRLFLGGCFVVFLGLAGGLGYAHSAQPLFFISLSGIGCHFVWQMWALNLQDPSQSARLFAANTWVGFFFAVGLFYS